MNADPIRTQGITRRVPSSLVMLLALTVPCHQAVAQLWAGDPLHTDPAQLGSRLRTNVPPELRAPVAATAQSPENADNAGLVALDLSCATRVVADDPDNALWALQTLRASSAGATSPELSLPTAIQLTVCHSPQLRASWSQIAQQAAQLGQAEGAYWPQLDAGIGRERSGVSYADASYPATNTQATTANLVFNWRLWDFGARSARVQAAQAQVQAALASQNAALKKAIADALHAYTEVQVARARLQTQGQLLPLAQRNLLAAQRRQNNGAGSASDTLQALAAQARIQLDQSRAEGDLHKAQAQLVFQTGLPPGTAFETSPLLPATTREVTGVSSAQPVGQADNVNQVEPVILSQASERLLARTLDEWLAYARQHHPAIAAARAQLQAAQASLKAVQADRLPTVNLNMGHYENGQPTQTLSTVRSRENVVSVSVNLKVFSGFNNTYKVRAVQAAVEQKQIELQAVEQQTLQDLVQLHAEAHANLNNLRAAINLYRAAAAAAQSAQRQYEHGAIDILQLNQTLTALQQAQDDLVRAQLDWNRARLKLWLEAA